MISIKSTAASFVFAGLAVAHGAQPVRADGAKDLRVAPLKAINLDAGTKRAIGYYLADNGNCNLTVLLSDINYLDGTTPSASRVNVSVAAGTSAKVDTIDGTTMQFSCAAGARDMTVTTFARYAASPVLLKGVTATK
jgi:hypothetical protein